MERKGEDPAQRAVPEIATGKDFRPDLLRPLRDYTMLDANGRFCLFSLAARSRRMQVPVD